MPSTRNSSGHPAIVSDVVRAPLTAPIPVVLFSPIRARKSPIPQAAAILSETGMTLTSPIRRELCRQHGVHLAATKYQDPLTLSHAYQGQEDKHKTFDEDSRECQIVRDYPFTMKPDDLVSKVCVQSHTRSKGHGHIGEEAE